MNEKFNFRGQISDVSDFYMLAVLKKDKISEFISNNGSNFTELYSDGTTDKYFFLCQNQFRNPDGTTFQRLYWSCDPDDFQKSKNENHLNQGVVKVNCYTVNGKKSLRYRTTFSGTPNRIPEPGAYRNFSLNVGNLTGDEASPEFNFFRNKSYNLNNDYNYYSIPYNLKANLNFRTGGVNLSEGNPINWVFRKVHQKGSSVSSPDLTIPKPDTARGSSYVYNFVDIGYLNTQANLENSYFNYGSVKYETVTGTSAKIDFHEGTSILTVHPYISDLDHFPQHFADIKVRKSSTPTDNTVIYYKNIVKNGDSAEIFLENSVNSAFSRGLTREDTTINTGDLLDIILNVRNAPECFCDLGKGSNFNDYFDIYFIPSEEHAVFPGGHVLGNDSFFPACIKDSTSYEGGKIFTPVYNSTTQLSFYNSSSRSPFTSETDMTTNVANSYISSNCSSGVDLKINFQKLNNYKKIYTQLFFQILGVLNTDIWSETGEKGFPTIAKHENFPITFYTWTNWESARQSYMYDYCDNYNFCGFCYGKSHEGKPSCYADKHTRKHASLTSGNNILPPLATTSRTSEGGKVTDNPQDTYWIGFGVFGGLTLLWAGVSYYVHNLDKSRGVDTFGYLNILLFVFMVAVLVYMAVVIGSLKKCEDNPTASCPTFTNPTSEAPVGSGNESNLEHYTYYILPDGSKKPLYIDPYTRN